MHRGLGQTLETHVPGLVHRGQLRRIAKQDQRREDFLQIVELAFIQHRGLVDEPDVERIFAPLPARNEIRPAQPRRGQGTRDRLVRLVKGLGPIERKIGQPVDTQQIQIGPFALPRQPFRDALIFRVIDGAVKDAMDGRRGHAARAQHRGRLVRRREDRQRAPILAPLAFPIARDELNPRRLQSLVKLGQKQGFARARLADHRADRGLAPFGHQGAVQQINPRALQRRGDGIPGFGLVFGKGDSGGQAHGADPTRRARLSKGAKSSAGGSLRRGYLGQNEGGWLLSCHKYPTG